MIIEQIYDKPLAHGSYAVVSKGKVFLIDPGRNPEPYIRFAKEHNGQIVAVFETHPHADFASSHLEFQKKFGAKIYVNPKVGVIYDYEAMEHNDTVQIGGVTIKALFTPGHSPDHNSYLIEDENGYPQAVFTGDALFVGDVGRPDLREGAGNLQVNRKELAAMMYNTIHEVFADLPDDVKVYPAHGAGSLCGKSISEELTSTIGAQKQENWAFQINDKDLFIENFLEGQPFIPAYFPHSVEINRKGVPPLQSSIDAVPMISGTVELDDEYWIIDTRKEEDFKAGHQKGAINIPSGDEEDKFETWLGTILEPGEMFYLVAGNKQDLENAIKRTAKIGYEKYIKGGMVTSRKLLKKSQEVPLADFTKNPEDYTIIDLRNRSEVGEEKLFKNAINIPLPELKNRLDEVPQDKSIVVHCAGGYRSAIGSSILERQLDNDVKVYDMSQEVENFKNGELTVEKRD